MIDFNFLIFNFQNVLQQLYNPDNTQYHTWEIKWLLCLENGGLEINNIEFAQGSSVFKFNLVNYIF